MGQLTSLVRWHLKKSARRSVVAATWSCGGLARHRASRVRALTYHRFDETARDPFSVSPAVFERQMAWLAKERSAISLTQFERFMAGEHVVKDGSVLVTIDDGAPSVYEHALPILQRYGIPAVLFVPAGELRNDTSRGYDRGPNGRMTRDHVIELARSGMTIGSHAFTHRSLGRMSEAEARDEASRSRAELEDLLGDRVTSFAYPFGTRADFNEMTAHVLRETGYTSAFTSQHGAIVPGDHALTLPRVKVEGGEGIWMFQCLTRGGLDGWRWVDRTLWKMQAAEA